MRIKLKVHLYNYALIERRKEMGYTQLDFAKAVGINSNVYAKIERLQPPYRTETYAQERRFFPHTREMLNKITSFTGDDFNYLFPPDYLDALEKGLLPGDISKSDWIIEVPIDRLPSKDAPKLIESDNLLNDLSNKILEETLPKLIAELPAREAQVLRLRYGLNGNEVHSREGIGIKMGVTRERVRQIEYQALSRLRHPTIRRKLRGYLIP